MLRIFEFGVLLFDCFVYHQNVTCLKRFTRYGHYAGNAEDINVIIIGRLAVVSYIAVPKIIVFTLMTLC